ncbi:MAG: 1-acyl-sn-glycerol-3-phosphate acyltransferase [Clostridia bacterium]|nr:1-acyl-sn-glycerol-3-phosphate acyltransferase [Clostridia bacterium]
MKEILRKTIKFILKIVAIIIYRPKIKGKEKLEEVQGALICPNHVHALDSVVLVLMNKRTIRVLAKESLFKFKILKWLAGIFGVYPVKDGKKSMESMKISLKLLKNNELLLIFPEGTRNGMAKGVKPKEGAIKLAIKANVPIIPVGIQGSFKAFTKVRLNIGEPIYYSEYKEEINNKELLEELTQDLMNKIVKLRDEKI